MKKQTAVEWLLENISPDIKFALGGMYNSAVIKQAKEKEFNQIIDAWVDGNDSEPKEVTEFYAEKYYNRNYNNQTN